MAIPDGIVAALKRKAEAPLMLFGNAKKARQNSEDRMCEFYPAEMSNDRARKYITGEVPRPIELLEKAVSDTRGYREKVPVKNCVVHWFKQDLRTRDNKGLHLASALSQRHGVPLVCLYIVSPQDLEAHLTAPVRVDFMLRTLEVLERDLAALDIPLHVETVEQKRNVRDTVIRLCEEWGASHVFCNTEYEVDELRREAGLVTACLASGVSFNVVPDTCVVEPGKLKSGTGGPISVYSPWHRKWCAYLNTHAMELDECPRPGQNPPSTRRDYAALFNGEIPPAPENKQLSAEEQIKFRSMWPAGEHEAHERLVKFLSSRVSQYSDTRNLPAGNGTSVLSLHLAAGTLAARTVVRLAKAGAPNATLTDDRKQGHSMWIGEVAWRDFYKHVLVYWPFVCMHKPFKLEGSNLQWEHNESHFSAWCAGKTGYPLVDAGMRQLNHTGYVHNRVRMVVASFLAKHLLIDWRRGERYFMEHLVDGDFASNNGGWGFSASTGVDPQPYFRIFNPLLQSEKFDPEGEYIRRWVPELQGILDNKAIHDPYGRGAAAASLAKSAGYPKQIIDHKFARERALERYKAAFARTV